MTFVLMVRRVIRSSVSPDAVGTNAVWRMMTTPTRKYYQWRMMTIHKLVSTINGV